MYASEAKKSEFLVHLDRFSKYLKCLRHFEKQSKWTKTLIFLLSRHTQLSPIILNQIRLFFEKNWPSFSVLYSLQFKTGVHLLKVELKQLLTPSGTLVLIKQHHTKLFSNDISALQQDSKILIQLEL